MKTTEVLPDQMMNAVLGKLYDVLTMGDETVTRSANDFFSWCTPGVPYDEDQFDFLMQGFTAMIRKQEKSENGEEDGLSIHEKMGRQTAKLYQEAENLARLVDFIPSIEGIDDGKRRHNVMTKIWNPDGTVSGMYEHVMRMSQVVKSELSDEVKARIEKFRSLLVEKKTKVDLFTDEEIEVTEASELVKRYYEKMAAYEDAALEYSNYKISAMSAANPQAVHFWAQNARTLRRRVEAAYNDWVANGYKEEYEKIGAYISQVMSRDLTLLKTEYKRDLENALITGIASGSDFYYTTLLPGNFARAKGWTKFSFSKGEFESHYERNKKKWGAKSGFFGGFLKIGASGEGQKTEITSDVDWSSFSLEFEMAQAPIVRPWFHPEFLTSSYWRFHPDTKKTGQSDLLSDGKIPPTGQLVGYSTAAVFIRNLRLKFRTHSGSYESIQSAFKGGGGLSIGPFFAGGKYQSSNVEHDRESNFSQEGIEVPGMQLIGFRCHLLPKSPDPVEGIKQEDWV